jgi:hypothetical protein
MVLARGGDLGVDDIGEVERARRRCRVAARERLQPVEQRDHPPCWPSASSAIARAPLGRLVGVAGERRQPRLDRRERRAQLVACVGREAPGRLDRALAVGRRPRQRASIALNEAASARVSAGPVSSATRRSRSPRRRSAPCGAQAPQRAQHRPPAAKTPTPRRAARAAEEGEPVARAAPGAPPAR